MDEIEAGFVWHSLSEISGADLQAGDILVRDGHVEIFAYYDKNGKEYAYTWGKIYNKEPIDKKADINSITREYEGIWRLEK